MGVPRVARERERERETNCNVTRGGGTELPSCDNGARYFQRRAAERKERKKKEKEEKRERSCVDAAHGGAQSAVSVATTISPVQ